MKKAISRRKQKVLAAGCTAAGLGLAATYIAYLAIVIFCRIPSFVGYEAVVSFVLALVLLAVALRIVYACGCWIVRTGRFSK